MSGMGRREFVALLGGAAATWLLAARTQAAIPIVGFLNGASTDLWSDRLSAYVTSLNRPGGNLTGVTQLSVELAPKLLEFMHELVPSATMFGFLINPSNPAHESLPKDLEAAALALGVTVQILRASTEHDFDTV